MKDLPRTTELIESGMADGLHIGAQLYVSRDAQPFATLALGDAVKELLVACKQIDGDLA